MSLRIFFLKRIIFRFTLAFKKVLGDGEYQGLSKTKATKHAKHKCCSACNLFKPFYGIFVDLHFSLLRKEFLYIT